MAFSRTTDSPTLHTLPRETKNTKFIELEEKE
jgi:hypothetical protein